MNNVLFPCIEGRFTLAGISFLLLSAATNAQPVEWPHSEAELRAFKTVEQFWPYLAPEGLERDVFSKAVAEAVYAEFTEFPVHYLTLNTKFPDPYLTLPGKQYSSLQIIETCEHSLGAALSVPRNRTQELIFRFDLCHKNAKDLWDSLKKAVGTPDEIRLNTKTALQYDVFKPKAGWENKYYKQANGMSLAIIPVFGGGHGFLSSGYVAAVFDAVSSQIVVVRANVWSSCGNQMSGPPTGPFINSSFCTDPEPTIKRMLGAISATMARTPSKRLKQ